MNNWKEKLHRLEEKRLWIELGIFVNETARENPENVEIYIEAIYLLLIFLLDGEYNFELKQDEIAPLLMSLFEISNARFNDNAEYLFFIGYFMALAEWYFGEDDTTLSHQMLKKAKEIEPDNSLYDWAYRFSTNNQTALYLAKQLLLNSEKMNWLKSKGSAGEYMAEAIADSLKLELIS